MTKIRNFIIYLSLLSVILTHNQTNNTTNQSNIIVHTVNHTDNDSLPSHPHNLTVEQEEYMNKIKLYMTAHLIFDKLTQEDLIKMNPVAFMGLIEKDASFNPAFFIKEYEESRKRTEDFEMTNEVLEELKKSHPHLESHIENLTLQEKQREAASKSSSFLGDEETDDNDNDDKHNERLNKKKDQGNKSKRHTLQEALESFNNTETGQILKNFSNLVRESRQSNNRRLNEQSKYNFEQIFTSYDLEYRYFDMVNFPYTPSAHDNDRNIQFQRWEPNIRNPFYYWYDIHQVVNYIEFVMEKYVKNATFMQSWDVFNNFHNPEFTPKEGYENKTKKKWYEMCVDYTDMLGFLIYNVPLWNLRNIDFQMWVPLQKCSCDFGELLNPINGCPDGYQCNHNIGRVGRCYPSILTIKENIKYGTFYSSNNIPVPTQAELNAFNAFGRLPSSYIYAASDVFQAEVASVTGQNAGSPSFVQKVVNVYGK